MRDDIKKVKGDLKDCLKGTMKVTSELRPCVVKGRKALFHRWVENASVIEPSPMIGGHAGGIVKYTMAIVEYDDGQVDTCFPNDILFADSLIDCYCFNEDGK